MPRRHYEQVGEMKSKAPFNFRLKQAQLDSLWRNASTAREFTYLRTTCADQLVERLDDILKPLDRAADIGSATGEIGQALQRIGKFDAIKRFDQFATRESQVKELPSKYEGLESLTTGVVSDWNQMTPGLLEEGAYDVIMSNLSLHWVNDINDTLKQIRLALKPDGVFLGTMFGGDTLHELRASLAIAEQEREGGISAHVSPMLPNADACGVLGQAGFKLVTVDTAQIQVEFDNAFSLMRNLWWMGESNACTNRRSAVSRETMVAAAAIYQHLFGSYDGDKPSIPATFQVIFMIGWAPHESQPKPLQPGQGQVSLTKLGKGFSG